MRALTVLTPTVPFFAVGVLLLSGCSSEAPASDRGKEEESASEDQDTPAEEEGDSANALDGAETHLVEEHAMQVPVPDGWISHDEDIAFGDVGVGYESEEDLVVVAGGMGDRFTPPGEASLAEVTATNAQTFAEFFLPAGWETDSSTDGEVEIDGHPAHMVEEELTPEDPDFDHVSMRFVMIEPESADPVFTAYFESTDDTELVELAALVTESIYFE